MRFESVEAPEIQPSARPRPDLTGHGALVSTQTEPMRRGAATPEDEGRFKALMDTDMRQQAEINLLADGQNAVGSRVTTLETNFGDHHKWLARIDLELLGLKASQSPRSDLYRRLTSRKFLFSVVTALGAVFSAAAGFIPPEVGAVIAAVIASIWTMSEAFVDGENAKAAAQAKNRSPE